MRHTLLVPAAALLLSAAAAPPRPTTAPASIPARTLVVKAMDYAFALPDTIVAGRHVVRVTNSAAQTHEVFVARLAPGRSAADLLAWIENMQGPPPGLPSGGLTGLAHGVVNDLVLDLTPGNYALFCFVPTRRTASPTSRTG